MGGATPWGQAAASRNPAPGGPPPPAGIPLAPYLWAPRLSGRGAEGSGKSEGGAGGSRSAGGARAKPPGGGSGSLPRGWSAEPSPGCPGPSFSPHLQAGSPERISRSILQADALGPAARVHGEGCGRVPPGTCQGQRGQIWPLAREAPASRDTRRPGLARQALPLFCLRYCRKASKGLGLSPSGEGGPALQIPPHPPTPVAGPRPTRPGNPFPPTPEHLWGPRALGPPRTPLKPNTPPRKPRPRDNFLGSGPGNPSPQPPERSWPQGQGTFGGCPLSSPD
ncbi:basic salivary proline-rich protein 1-like [Sarcophilus harrisii]|uniref:basic salivary proline-rich protein 1-like n=1 Tax=Sarcophilus harrisii TaxID=9305 RepID=UPI001302033B|nr:basic salivary proline-rich protein 1-like [Sarcophilus harrisii]